MGNQPIDEQPNVVWTKPLLSKKGGITPSVIHDIIPTEPLTLNFGPGRGTATKGVGSAWLMGSKYLLGTPSYSQFAYQVTRLRLTTGTPNVFFAFTHSRKPGTFDTPFEVSKGDDLTVGDPKAPIYSLLPGTLRIYALGPGSSISPGKGTNSKFQGFGSSAAGPVSVSMDLYAI